MMIVEIMLFSRDDRIAVMEPTESKQVRENGDLHRVLSPEKYTTRKPLIYGTYMEAVWIFLSVWIFKNSHT